MITTGAITLGKCDGCPANNVPVLWFHNGPPKFRLCGQCLANATSKLWKAESRLPHRDCQMPHETIEELKEADGQ